MLLATSFNEDGIFAGFIYKTVVGDHHKRDYNSAMQIAGVLRVVFLGGAVQTTDIFAG